MMFLQQYGIGVGFAIIMGFLLLAVIIYTIINLRKQVSKRKAEEREKSRRNKMN